MDMLACLIWLLRESAESRSVDTVRIGHALHNVLIIMALELYSLRIALPLLQLLIQYILPLGLPLYHRMGMSSFDYLSASGHLNRIAYESLKAPKQSLEWGERAKIMQQLINGKFGEDVRFAMLPKFELDGAAGGIPINVLEVHENVSRLSKWGWTCVLSYERLPGPANMGG
ncbi:hypothetical protein [Pseudomonas sp. dw_612]|uniref:hypothetical protein n=1 Tax=Pseudomonas sp. dw_612 TaxID=2720080 RepID=UPI001BD201CF|nr:hypothetical protein [Pseudomonas sp. dw_612]